MHSFFQFLHEQPFFLIFGTVALGMALGRISCLAITLLPAIVACIIGRKVLHLNPALLLGALAGARQCTASLKVAQEVSDSPVPAIGYPVPLAIATVALSIASYFLALFF